MRCRSGKARWRTKTELATSASRRRQRVALIAGRSAGEVASLGSASRAREDLAPKG